MKKLALVIDNNDPDLKGKVQVRIFPEMNSYSVDDLPWARPLIRDISGMSKENGAFIHSVPELDSFIYCEVSEDWTAFYYLDEVPYLEPKYPYESLLEEVQNAIEDLEEQTYPQPRLLKDNSGKIQFTNTETGEQGTIFPSGSFIHIRSNGTMKLKYLESEIDFLENGSIQFVFSNVSFLFDNESKKVIFSNVESFEIGNASDFAVLFSPLKEILEKLLDHNHIAPTGPTMPAQESSGAPLSALKSRLENMKSIIQTD